MKKFIALTTAVILIFTLASCGNNEYPIDSQKWIMTTVQNTKDGSVVACGSDNTNVYDNALKIELICKAEKGTLTINDTTNNKIYSGEYKINSTSSDSTIYEITVEEKEGMAVVSYTKYNDDSKVSTLILSIEDYSINFFEKK